MLVGHTVDQRKDDMGMIRDETKRWQQAARNSLYEIDAAMSANQFGDAAKAASDMKAAAAAIERNATLMRDLPQPEKANNRPRDIAP